MNKKIDDYSEVISQIDNEMKRLKMSKIEGREHLSKTYGHKSRQVLTDEQLLEFLSYLKSL